MVNREDTGLVFEHRSKKNWMLSQSVVRAWRQHVQRFVDDAELRKVGHTVSSEGFLWMNFGYLRASYARRLIRPRRTEQRFWYEWWSAILEPVLYEQCARPCEWNRLPRDASIDSVESSLFPCTSRVVPDEGTGMMGEWCYAGPGHSWSAAGGDRAYSGQLLPAEDWTVLQMHGNATVLPGHPY